jgi:hypothetical protein
MVPWVRQYKTRTVSADLEKRCGRLDAACYRGQGPHALTGPQPMRLDLRGPVCDYRAARKRAFP